jgi:hypothetical protein
MADGYWGIVAAPYRPAEKELMTNASKILRDTLAKLTAAQAACKNDDWGYEADGLNVAKTVMSTACTDHLAAVLDRLDAIEAAAKAVVNARGVMTRSPVPIREQQAIDALVKLATGRE